MNQQHETFVISRTEEGFRVYNPADPTKSYIVGGGPDEPTCTCPDFQYDGRGQRCKHILAVLAQYEKGGADTYEAEERAAIQAEGRPAEEKAPTLPANGSAAQMVIKRSVSPDGRIDSLSVEFSIPVSETPAGEIKARAFNTLKLQDDIVGSFLAANGRGNGNPPAEPRPAGNGPAPAQMLYIGGINTKWGRRLYIAFESNGDKLKLFGARKNLADALVAAGYTNLAERIDEGKQLNVPCRITTKPSEDGRYINVEQVLPAETQRRRW